MALIIDRSYRNIDIEIQSVWIRSIQENTVHLNHKINCKTIASVKCLCSNNTAESIAITQVNDNVLVYLDLLHLLLPVYLMVSMYHLLIDPLYIFHRLVHDQSPLFHHHYQLILLHF